jgi:hypothetical protein
VIQSIEMGDRAGIAVAVACAFHCVAAPILGTSIQIAGAFASEGAELAFLGSSLLISGTTVVANCLRHSVRGAVWRTFVVGAALLLVARSGVAWAEMLEQPLVIGGAGMIVAAALRQPVQLLVQEGGSVMCGNRVVAAIGALLVGLAAIVVAG